MKNDSLVYFIGECIDGFEKNAIANAKVKKINLDDGGGELDITAAFESFVPCDMIDSIRRKVKETMGLKSVNINCVFSPECFDSAAMPFVAKILKERKPAANGFFDDARYSFEGDTLTVKIKGDETLLQNTGCTQEAEKIIFELFGKKVGVIITGEKEKNAVNDGAAAQNEKQEQPAETVAPPHQPEKKRKKSKKETGSNEVSLPVSRENSVLLLGSEIKSSPIRMSDITVNDGTVTVWGRVFAPDIRDTRDGTKKIIKFNLEDGTGAFAVKIFESADKCEQLSSFVKEGCVLIVKGSIEFDSYMKMHCIRARSVMTGKEIEKTDDAPEKRVELHLHTSMSQMDGVTGADKLVKRAIKWGHRAVAITDHGVVQAFPDAFKAAKGSDIKIIYGMEGYMVDDSVTAVVGGSKMPLDGEFVIFDVETTGLRTGYDRLIEIGAVKYTGGVEKSSFRTFVDPGIPIPDIIVKLTGIDSSMVQGAPDEETAVRKFLEFAGDAVLVAHNAVFDTDFIKSTCQRHGIPVSFTYVDTLLLSQELTDPEKIKNHKLDTVAAYFKLPKFDHHRADEDARILALIFEKLVSLLKQRGVETIDQINGVIKPDPKKLRSHHIILLAKNTKGLKNLYKLITLSNLEYYRRSPRIPLSELNRHREGILVGSACEAGQLFSAVLAGKPHETLLKYAKVNDYIELQPNGNNSFLLRNGTLKNEEELNDINRQLIALADEAGLPVVATGDVHFMDESDAVYREIIMTSQGFSDAAEQAPLYFKTTDEMLSDFSYLPPEKAKEIVIDNPNKIADMCEIIRPVPEGVYPPFIEGADRDLRRICNERMESYYGSPLPQYIRDRLDKELDSIIKHGFAVLYMIAQKLVANSEEHGYYVGSRGSVGSSFVAFAAGISEVNPLAPHYVCTGCRHSEFFLKGEYGSGFDMPPKDCPVCGKPMHRDGHDIPFETFLGFKGDKQPDIDLNFSSEYQFYAHRYTEELFGKDHVFKAGTIGTVAEKTAFGYVKKWIEENLKLYKNEDGTAKAGLTQEQYDRMRFFEEIPPAEMERLAHGCTGVKRTTGQHPGGMVVVPANMEAEDFTPIQHPADDAASIHRTTHFDFHFLHDTILKLDNLGHEVPTMYHHLEKLTGTSVMDADVCDPKLYALLTSPEPLGVTAEEIECPTGTLSLPELGTSFVLGMLSEAKPKNFSDMLQISGLSHGTDVWLGNAQELIKDGTCTISEVIGTRDSIMVYLIHKGVPDDMAFKIMEIVRKGNATKLLTQEHKDTMLSHGVPQWYIDSCMKIKYMFPKAHAAAYVIAAMRLAWYKLYYPVEYYATYLTVRGGDLETSTVMAGRTAVKMRMTELDRKIKAKQSSDKENDIYTSLQVINEMMARGVELLPVDIYRSMGTRYIVEDGKIRLPFASVPGCGENAAMALEKARYKRIKKTNPDGTVTEEITDEQIEFLSIEEIQTISRASQTVMNLLEQGGAFASLPKTTQLSFF
ncbi:MAG: PolC-type DNA polymerase III [Clostridiales bacterium]|nr:PolC-type DNA polymerase III [Clostridiales bacterium]